VKRKEDLEGKIEFQKEKVRQEQEVLDKLRREALDFEVLEKKKEVGNCFKSLNTTSEIRGSKKKWWQYSKIIDVNERGDFVLATFQLVDIYREYLIDIVYEYDLSHHIPITSNEYCQEKRIFFEAVNKLLGEWEN